jgi:hypothetical protein
VLVAADWLCPDGVKSHIQGLDQAEHKAYFRPDRILARHSTNY